MASRVELANVTIPAGTLVAAPFTQATPFDIGEVEGIEILIPPGPSGLVGFQVVHSGEPVLPREADRWIIADSESIKWPLVNMPQGRSWGIRGYNLDTYDHTLYIRYLVRELGAPILVNVPALGIAQPDQAAPVDESGPSIVDDMAEVT